MQLLGIPSYPVRWRRILWTVILLDIIVTLGGNGTPFSGLLSWLSRNEDTKFYFT